ncbi:MAG: gliding motility lipoprotein GldD [Bacteroidetes bacterium]|nr:gliding motility lipoprotein GldD [Bacteroidota bacterium]
MEPKKLASNKWVIILLILTLIYTGCERDYTPKPKGYPRVFLPEKSYVTFDIEECPFTFQYAAYSEIDRNVSFFNMGEGIDCWLDIKYPAFQGTIHLSYKPLNDSIKLSSLLDDTHFLTFKHTVKADYIDEGYISTANNVFGLYYDVGGNAASPFQFFLTDSVNHFLRGALYFYTTPNVDSLKPIIEFVKVDIYKFIDTFEWKDK